MREGVIVVTARVASGLLRYCAEGRDKRHAKDMEAAEVEAFLTSLSVDRKISASIQNQALTAVA